MILQVDIHVTRYVVARSPKIIHPNQWLRSASDADRQSLPFHARRELLRGHVSRLSNRWLNLDIGSLNSRELTGSLGFHQPGIVRIKKFLARVRIL